MIASASLLGVFVIAGLVFDFGLWFVTRSQLQNITDTAALGGARVLGAIYAGGDYDDDGDDLTPPITLNRKLVDDQKSYLQNSADDSIISGVVNTMANQHRAGGVSININPTDLVVGIWDYQTNVFIPGVQGVTLRPNAVQVTARRDPANNGALATVFGRLVGLNSFSINATAIAALTPIRDVPPNNPPPLTVPPGEIQMPLAIDAAYNFCPTPEPACNASGLPPACITLSINALPAPLDDCTASTTFDGPLTDWGQILAGTITSPQTTVGDMYTIRGDGDLDYAALTDFYQAQVGFNPGVPWAETLLPVYAANGCAPGGPPPGPRPIVGFVNTRIFATGGAAAGTLFLSFACQVVSTGRSGGQAAQDFGTFGSVPVLVQ